MAVSSGVADDLSEITGIARQRIRVIYNPIITPELVAKAKEPLAHPWFNRGEPPMVLAAGRLTKQKDFATLVRAFALARSRCKARLLILVRPIHVFFKAGRGTLFLAPLSMTINVNLGSVTGVDPTVDRQVPLRTSMHGNPPSGHVCHRV